MVPQPPSARPTGLAALLVPGQGGTGPTTFRAVPPLLELLAVAIAMPSEFRLGCGGAPAGGGSALLTRLALPLQQASSPIPWKRVGVAATWRPQRTGDPPVQLLVGGGTPFVTAHGRGIQIRVAPDGDARDEAEDLVQDTYLRAFRAWEQYTPGTRCKSWLFTICRNVFLRGRERSRRRDEILLETAQDDPRAISREAPVFAASRDEDPEGEFFRSIVDDKVFAAIDQLPEEYRMVVVLSDLEDLSYGEIAEVMEIPVGTVKSRLFRGRRQLQRQLYEYALEMGYISEAGEK